MYHTSLPFSLTDCVNQAMELCRLNNLPTTTLGVTPFSQMLGGRGGGKVSKSYKLCIICANSCARRRLRCFEAWTEDTEDDIAAFEAIWMTLAKTGKQVWSAPEATAGRIGVYSSCNYNCYESTSLLQSP